MDALTDRQVAEQAVLAGGRAAHARFRQPLAIAAKADRMDLVSDADYDAEAAILETLAVHRPDDGTLSEESPERLGERTWVIDPLDGTLNFCRGLAHFCCAVALSVDGATRAAAVYDPVADELFSADQTGPTTLNGKSVKVSTPELETAVIATYLDRNHLGADGSIAFHHQLAANAGSVRCGGSGTLDLAHVAVGRLDGWVQPVKPRWDWEPGAFLVTRAGGVADTSAWKSGEWSIAASVPLHDRLRQLAAAA